MQHYASSVSPQILLKQTDSIWI